MGRTGLLRRDVSIPSCELRGLDLEGRWEAQPWEGIGCPVAGALLWANGWGRARPEAGAVGSSANRPAERGWAPDTMATRSRLSFVL